MQDKQLLQSDSVENPWEVAAKAWATLDGVTEAYFRTYWADAIKPPATPTWTVVFVKDSKVVARHPVTKIHEPIFEEPLEGEEQLWMDLDWDDPGVDFESYAVVNASGHIWSNHGVFPDEQTFVKCLDDEAWAERTHFCTFRAAKSAGDDDQDSLCVTFNLVFPRKPAWTLKE